MKRINNFNQFIGDKLAFGLSTMTMFYIVTIFVLFPLIWQRPDNLIGWVQFLIQSLFQGAALPILAYVSRLEGAKTEKVLQETHDNLIIELQKQNEEFEKIKEMMSLLQEENLEIHMLINSISDLQIKLNTQ